MILLTGCIITTGKELCTWIWLFILPFVLQLDKGCVTCIWIFILPDAIPRTMIDINRKLANECIILKKKISKRKHSFEYILRYFFFVSGEWSGNDPGEILWGAGPVQLDDVTEHRVGAVFLRWHEYVTGVHPVVGSHGYTSLIYVI